MAAPVQVWRICRSKYAATAFSGEGSFRYAARWNYEGIRMVYTASSLALAAMETFVHLELDEEPNDLVSVSAILPANLEIEALDPDALPPGWNRLNQASTQSIGSLWARSRRSVALRVPSVAVRGDFNLLLNPEHPHFALIERLPPIPWAFDPRMFRSFPTP